MERAEEEKKQQQQLSAELLLGTFQFVWNIFVEQGFIWVIRFPSKSNSKWRTAHNVSTFLFVFRSFSLLSFSYYFLFSFHSFDIVFIIYIVKWSFPLRFWLNFILPRMHFNNAMTYLLMVLNNVRCTILQTWFCVVCVCFFSSFQCILENRHAIKFNFLLNLSDGFFFPRPHYYLVMINKVENPPNWKCKNSIFIHFRFGFGFSNSMHTHMCIGIIIYTVSVCMFSNNLLK